MWGGYSEPSKIPVVHGGSGRIFGPSRDVLDSLGRDYRPSSRVVSSRTNVNLIRAPDGCPLAQAPVDAVLA